jgi:tetratricopeptide (TPR) repeat protein
MGRSPNREGAAFSRALAGLKARPSVQLLMRRVTVALIVCLTAATAADAQRADPLAPFTRAVSLQQRGDFEGAATAYREFLAAYPDNVAARSNLGVVLVRLGRYEEAIEAYRAALAAAPANTAVRHNLGIALYKAARFEDAASELASVTASAPDNLQARYLEADCYLRLGKPTMVIGLLEPLESKRPDDLALAYLLGLAYLQQERLADGQRLIDRILRNGDSAEARLMMGVARRGVQDLAGAVADLAKAVVLNPDLPGVHSLYGQALLETGDRDKARVELEQALTRDPLDFDANLLVGVMLKDEAEYARAMTHFTRALGVRPGNPAVRYQIATVHISQGDNVTALPLLEAIVKDAPKFLEAHVSLATVYYRLQRREDGARERAIVEALNRENQARQINAASPPR